MNRLFLIASLAFGGLTYGQSDTISLHDSGNVQFATHVSTDDPTSLYKIFNMSGALVLVASGSEKNITEAKDKLSTGFYIYWIEDSKGASASGKFYVQ